MDDLLTKLSAAKVIAADLICNTHPELSNWLHGAVANSRLVSGSIRSITLCNGTTQVGGFTKDADTVDSFEWIVTADDTLIGKSIAEWTISASEAGILAAELAADKQR